MKISIPEAADLAEASDPAAVIALFLLVEVLLLVHLLSFVAA